MAQRKVFQHSAVGRNEAVGHQILEIQPDGSVLDEASEAVSSAITASVAGLMLGSLLSPSSPVVNSIVGAGVGIGLWIWLKYRESRI